MIKAKKNSFHAVMNENTAATITPGIHQRQHDPAEHLRFTTSIDQRRFFKLNRHASTKP
jgi:hypothetical protein